MAVGGILLILAGAPSHAQIILAPGPTFPVNSQPELVATGDFDNDGRVDVAVLEPGTTVITVLFGDAASTLARRLDVPLGGYRMDAFVVADVNGDGVSDLVGVTDATDQVLLALSNGNGEFATGAATNVGRRPADVAAGNFDSVRNNDLVVVDQDDDRISVLLNNGGVNPSFTVVGDLAVGNRPKRVLAGDLNGDQLDDIVVLNTGLPNNDDISVLLNPGNGHFADQTRYGVGPRAKDMALVDVNGDGALDVVVLNGKQVSGRANEFTLSVFVNRSVVQQDRTVGTGLFDAAADVNTTCPTTLAGIPVFCDPKRLAFGDFNGDGFVDLAMSFTTLAKVGSLFTPGVLTALAGSGDGTFSPGTQADIADRPFGLAAHDFNGDGIRDLAVADAGDSSLRIVVALPPAQRVNGTQCTSGIQCESTFCTDGVCCASAHCPLGEACNFAGVAGSCSHEPTQTATRTATATRTPTPTPLGVGVPCTPGTPSPCDVGLFCTDGTCCTSVTCDASARCDIFGATGQCTAPLGVGHACEKNTDCAIGLYCAAGPEGGSSVCTPLPTPTPPPPATETPTPVATRTAGGVCTGECPCAGDCDNDHTVTIDELLALVTISLGDAPLSACPAGDAGGDGAVTIDDIVAATSNALNGCPAQPV
jgi:VCBS repeat protein